MLMSMRSHIEAMRALAYYTNAALDRARHHTDDAVRKRDHVRMDLLTPVVKAWCTDIGFDLASTGVQIHGGMGFIEETGAAQHLRDARIALIYEGTNGIQAIDLLGRKLLRDGGAGMNDLIEEIEASLADIAAAGPELGAMPENLRDGVAALRAATEWLLDPRNNDLERKFAGATPFLHLTGTVVGGWLLARGALAAQRRLAAANGDASVVIISSISAAETSAAGAYGALKATQIHLAKGLAKEHAGKHIRFNTVSPGTVYFKGGVWGMVEEHMPDMFKATMARNPMGRMATPQDIANATVFLSSPASSFTTGINMIVDGTLTGRVNF